MGRQRVGSAFFRMMRSNNRAPQKPIRRGLSATLERGGCESRQMAASLSVPITATSSGTRSPALRQASSTRVHADPNRP